MIEQVEKDRGFASATGEQHHEVPALSPGTKTKIFTSKAKAPVGIKIIGALELLGAISIILKLFVEELTPMRR